MINEERIKDIALSRGYSEVQVETAFEFLNKANISVIEKEDYLFDIKNNETNEIIHEAASIEMAIEIGFDALRTIAENTIREGKADEKEIASLVDSLNSIYENTQYTIAENKDGKYLALQL